jgi:tetratricopeptide (TPR) repeat protein
MRKHLFLPFGCALLLSVGCTKTVKNDPPPKREVVVEKTAEEIHQEALSMHKEGKRSGSLDHAQVEKLYRQAIEKKPSLSAAHFNLAALYEDMGQYNRATRQLGQALQGDEKNPEATYRLVQLYVRQKQHDNALRTFYRYLRLNPEGAKKAEMQINLASLQVAGNQYEDALKTARGILALDPENIEAYRVIAGVYLKQKKYKIVHLVYQLAEKTKKKDARLFNIRGLAFMSEQKMPEAMYFFGEAVKADPTLFSAQMNLGLLALRYHDYARALSTLEQAVKLRPLDQQALLGYALALRANRKFEEAEKVYQERLLKNYPSHAPSVFNLAVLHLRFMNKPKLAEVSLRRYIGEQGSRIGEKHAAYQLLKESQDRIKMLEAEEKEKLANKPKPRAKQTNTKDNIDKSVPKDLSTDKLEPDKGDPNKPEGGKPEGDKPAPRS